MKILVILTGAMQYDGITNSVYNYYAAMDRSDIEIDIISARSTLPEMAAQFEAIACKVIQLECRDINPVLYLFKLAKFIRKEEYDIVHAHGNSATLSFETLAALLGGCKVRIVHSRNSSCEHVTINRMLRPLLYATFTDGFACGEKAGEWLFNDRPFTIIQNGKDLDRFLFNPNKRCEFRNRLDTTEDTVLLGHVGLFHPQKNHILLIDIFSEIAKKDSRYKLVLIGTGEEQETIKQKVDLLELNDKVVFLGQQTNVQDWLQALDIMVFPSLFEGMPNVVLEWQIAGLPAIMSDTITRECKITDLVEYMPLEDGAVKWANKILGLKIGDRDGTQEKIKLAFVEAGFDIRKNATFLKQKYVELLQMRTGRLS